MVTSEVIVQDQLGFELGPFDQGMLLVFLKVRDRTHAALRKYPHVVFRIVIFDIELPSRREFDQRAQPVIVRVSLSKNFTNQRHDPFLPNHQ
jgi:hypothetical protein